MKKMKKLIMAIVVTGVLSVTGVATAHNHRDRGVYMGYRGGGYDIEGWFPLPFPRMERRHGDYGHKGGYGYRDSRHDEWRRHDHPRRERRDDREHFYFYYR